MVYFIQAGENGPIKIGTSTVPQIHLDRLQQGNHEELNLVAEIPGERNLEKKVRADLEVFERGRQWFYPTDEVLDYIEKMQLIEYDMVDGVPLAILWRDSEDGETDHCPFCGERHKHEGKNGHYEAVCAKAWLSHQRESKDCTILKREDGYIIRTRDEDSVSD
jgi:hypothetical protein